MTQPAAFAIPTYTTADEIKELRARLGLTQRDFAALVNSSKPTIERWERSSRPITGPIVTLIYLLQNSPDAVQNLTIPERSTPLRLWYMHEQQRCTLMDIDEMRQSIRIINYTGNLLFRAFGEKEAPDYKDYMDFLESRCFPDTRDKLKLVLEDLELPFYDPLLIIEKTQGRMAEDHFWLQIER